MTLKLTKAFWLGLILLPVFTNLSYADDSAMIGGGGGTVAPMAQHPSVRMVSETVTIKLTDKGAKVHCEFHFKNEGKACMVKMGFPDKAWGSGEGGDISAQSISSFRSSVDDKPIKCVYKRGKKVDQYDQTTSSNLHCDSWYVKDVPFDANQTRTVIDDYWTDLGSQSDSMMTGYQATLSFNYILRTGRNWKGPIGKAKIILDDSAVPNRYNESFEPAGCGIENGRAVWNFSNFEPKEDISVELRPYYPKLNGNSNNDGDPGYDNNATWEPFCRTNGVTMTGTGFLEQLGATIEDKDKGVHVIKYHKHILKVTEGSKTALLDGKNITLQAAPNTDYGRLSIPAAYIVRALGGKARYSEKEGRLLLWL